MKNPSTGTKKNPSFKHCKDSKYVNTRFFESKYQQYPLIIFIINKITILMMDIINYLNKKRNEDIKNELSIF